MTVSENVKTILAELPAGVQLVTAAKGRSVREVQEAVTAGITIIGENYLQDAVPAHKAVGGRVKWHFIGHLQKNKVKKAVGMFDLIETVDSTELAGEISRSSLEINKVIPVLIEINSGRESQKHGVFPENAGDLIKEISDLPGIQVAGLMTMGPVCDLPEGLRPYFAITKRVFDAVTRLELPRVEMKYLSMGMSGSYSIAIEEGANIVRIGTKIFG
jgi:PLP dependent protein